jgi:hypothetical protein
MEAAMLDVAKLESSNGDGTVSSVQQVTIAAFVGALVMHSSAGNGCPM